MTTPATPSNEKPAGDDRNLVAVDENYKALTFEDTVNQIWKRNRNLVWGLIGLVAAVVLGKGGWEYMQHQRELGVGKDYAAATTSAQLKAFAASHSGHSLAGVAHLRVADEAYTAGKPADAIAAYDQAAAILKTGPLAARAKIGRAMAKVQSGKAPEGSNELKQIAADTTQLNSVRAEATYHLASLASESGDAAEVIKYSDELNKLAPSSPWAQRGTMLRASLPVTATPMITTTPTAPTTPAPAAKKDEPKGPEVQVKLPGGK
jgi:hypothetical protein